MPACMRGTHVLPATPCSAAEMDGIEASRRLREALQPEQRPVVVALSADTLQMQDEKCKAAGFAAFICKPFRVEDVERVLAMVQPPKP